MISILCLEMVTSIYLVLGVVLVNAVWVYVMWCGLLHPLLQDGRMVRLRWGDETGQCQCRGDSATDWSPVIIVCDEKQIVYFWSFFQFVLPSHTTHFANFSFFSLSPIIAIETWNILSLIEIPFFKKILDWKLSTSNDFH